MKVSDLHQGLRVRVIDADARGLPEGALGTVVRDAGTFVWVIWDCDGETDAVRHVWPQLEENDWLEPAVTGCNNV